MKMKTTTKNDYQKVINNIANLSYDFHAEQAKNGNKQAVTDLVNRVLEMHTHDKTQLDKVIQARHHLLHTSLKNVVTESERHHAVDAIKELSNYLKEFKITFN